MRRSVCDSADRVTGDANGDGCADIVDLQAELAAQGLSRPAAAAASGNFTFTVVSTADTPDAAPGNGVCADAGGRCTLRAAMSEANVDAGNDRIEFNLAGTPPVTIEIRSQLPTISSRKGTMTIDGYSEPGSQVNTAAFGSNAVPGVEVRGPGVDAATFGIYITSFGNTLRGLALSANLSTASSSIMPTHTTTASSATGSAFGATERRVAVRSTAWFSTAARITIRSARQLWRTGT